jgi:hypothetical protein
MEQKEKNHNCGTKILCKQAGRIVSFLRSLKTRKENGVPSIYISTSLIKSQKHVCVGFG